MEESISGFRQRGGWNAIVEHGERITRALRDQGAAGEDLAEWDEWRPKSHERLGEDVNEKTAAQATVEEGEGERAGKGPDEDLKQAGEKLAESVEGGEDATETLGESVEYAARAADSAGRKAIRAVEGTVYRTVMTQVAPYYFDNELVSANVQRTTRDADGPGYVFEINVNDDDLKEQVSTQLAEYDDEIDRWHVSTARDVETAAVAEGAEVADAAAEPDDDAKPTTN